MASRYVEKIKTLAFATENDSQFGTNLSGTATFTNLRIRNGAEISFSREMIPNDVLQTSKFASADSIVGVKPNPVAKIPTFAYGAGVPLSATIAPVQDDVGGMLQTIFGGMTVNSGSAVSSTTGSGSVTLLASNGPRFKPGMMAGVSFSDGLTRFRPILSMSADTLTMAANYQTAPANGANVYNAFTYYHQEQPTGSLQFLLTNHNPADLWVAPGGNGSAKRKYEHKKPTAIDFEVTCVDWLSGSGAVDVNTVFLTSSTSIFTNCELLIWVPDGVNPIYSLPVEFTSIEVTPNTKWEDIQGPHGVNNVIDRVLIPVDPSVGAYTIAIEAYWADFTWIRGLEQDTTYSIFLQSNFIPGKIFGEYHPACQLIEATRKANGNIPGISLKFATRLDRFTAANSAGLTELQKSPCKLFKG